MREPSRQPVADHRRLLRSDLFGGLRPARDELPLQLALLRRQYPITRFTPHLVTRTGKPAFGAINGVRSCRPAKALVVRSLVPVHEIPNRVVFRFRRRASRATVVVEREERGGAAGPATPGQRAQPLVRNQVEQCRGGDQMAAREQGRMGGIGGIGKIKRSAEIPAQRVDVAGDAWLRDLLRGAADRDRQPASTAGPANATRDSARSTRSRSQDPGSATADRAADERRSSASAPQIAPRRRPARAAPARTIGNQPTSLSTAAILSTATSHVGSRSRTRRAPSASC